MSWELCQIAFIKSIVLHFTVIKHSLDKLFMCSKVADIMKEVLQCNDDDYDEKVNVSLNEGWDRRADSYS